MTFDFDTRPQRRGTASEKWDALERLYGSADVLPMWVADMDFACPPAVVEAVVARARHGVYGYTDYTEPVYGAVQGWMRERHGLDVPRDWIGFAHGVVPSLAFILKGLTRAGDGILIQPPTYYPFAPTIELNGRRVVNNPLVREGGRYRMDLDDLREKARDGVKAAILCSPHNPVGRVWTREELRAFGDVCLEHGILVISDEVHSDLTYPGVVHTPYLALGAPYADRAMLLHAPSKTFNLAGMQTSYTLIPNPALRAAYEHVVHEVHLHQGSPFGLVALEAAYTRGGAWYEGLRGYLAGNLAYLEDFVAREIPGVEAIHPEGTYVVWLDCRGLGMEPEALARFMNGTARVALSHGPSFGAGGAGYERINIACPRSMLVEALDRIAAAVRSR